MNSREIYKDCAEASKYNLRDFIIGSELRIPRATSALAIIAGKSFSGFNPKYAGLILFSNLNSWLLYSLVSFNTMSSQKTFLYKSCNKREFRDPAIEESEEAFIFTLTLFLYLINLKTYSGLISIPGQLKLKLMESLEIFLVNHMALEE